MLAIIESRHRGMDRKECAKALGMMASNAQRVAAKKHRMEQRRACIEMQRDVDGCAA